MPGSRCDQRLIEVFGNLKMIDSTEDVRDVDKDDAEYLDTVSSGHDFTSMDRATLEKKLCASLNKEEEYQLRIHQLEQEVANLKGFQTHQHQEMVARFQAKPAPTVNIASITNHYYSSAPAVPPAPTAQVPIVEFGSLALRPRVASRVRIHDQTAVSKPRPPRFRTICRRRSCKRKVCSFVHDDQRKLYQELIAALPEWS